MRALIIGGAFVGAGPLWYWLEAPWFVTGMCLLSSLFVVPFLVGDVRSAFRSSNWLMRIDGEEVWLNIRSYAHHDHAGDQTILETSFSEVEKVTIERIKFVGPMGVSNGAVISQSSTVLRLEFRNPLPEEILQALQAERERIAQRTYLGGITVSSRSHDDPVSMDGERSLVLLWTSQNTIVRPAPNKAMELFANAGVAVDDVQERTWLWSSLADEEQDVMIDQLRRRGRIVEAARLSDRRRTVSV